MPKKSRKISYLRKVKDKSRRIGVTYFRKKLVVKSKARWVEKKIVREETNLFSGDILKKSVSTLISTHKVKSKLKKILRKRKGKTYIKIEGYRITKKGKRKKIIDDSVGIRRTKDFDKVFRKKVYGYTWAHIRGALAEQDVENTHDLIRLGKRWRGKIKLDVKITRAYRKKRKKIKKRKGGKR